MISGRRSPVVISLPRVFLPGITVWQTFGTKSLGIPVLIQLTTEATEELALDSLHDGRY
jgi:hypothetical protein